MGLKSPRIYFDSCVAIYLIEEHPIFAPQIENRLAVVPDVRICSSYLTEMESLVMPLRNKNRILIKKFEDWFEASDVLLPDRAVFQNAARLRAEFPVKTPDALHLSTALHHNCDEFWTNDNRLDKIAPHLVKNIL